MARLLIDEASRAPVAGAPPRAASAAGTETLSSVAPADASLPSGAAAAATAAAAAIAASETAAASDNAVAAAAAAAAAVLAAIGDSAGRAAASSRREGSGVRLWWSNLGRVLMDFSGMGWLDESGG